MLVFWMQKIVSIDASWQSRVFPLGGDPRSRRQWEKHKQFTLVRSVSLSESLTIATGVRRIRSSHLSNYGKDVIVVSQPDAEDGRFSDRKLKHAWVFHDDIFVLLSAEDALYLSVEGVYYREYNTKQVISSTISSVTVYLNLLCLETSAGEVFIYQLSDAIDIIDLDLTNPAWTGTVSSCPVTCMVLGMYNGNMSLVTGGSEGVTITKWASQLSKASGMEQNL